MSAPDEMPVVEPVELSMLARLIVSAIDAHVDRGDGAGVSAVLAEIGPHLGQVFAMAIGMLGAAAVERARHAAALTEFVRTVRHLPGPAAADLQVRVERAMGMPAAEAWQATRAALLAQLDESEAERP